MTLRFSSIRMTLLAAVVTLGFAPFELEGQDRPTLAFDDYDRWEQLGPAELSSDGGWLAVSIGRVSDEDELRIHHTDSDSVIVAPYGVRPRFSRDGLWLVYGIGRSEEERDAARRADETPKDDVGILDLTTGAIDIREGVQSFSLSADGRFVALRRYPSDDQEHAGTDMVVEELASGTRMLFGNVSDAAWPDQGSLLAMTVDGADRVGNGISLYDPNSNALRPLDQDEAVYRQMRWREDAADLAVLKTAEDPAFSDTTHVALAWRGLDGAAPSAFMLDGGAHAQLSSGMRIVEHRAPTWSEDGSVVFVGVQPRLPAPEDPCSTSDQESDATAPAGPGGPSDAAEAEGADAATCDDEENGDEDEPSVEIWHARDFDPIPQQRVRERQLREANDISAWDLDLNTFVQLGDELTERTAPVPGGRHVIGMDETPYEEHAMFRQQFLDLYAIDVASGAKSLVKERVPESPFGSPAGRYVVWFEGEHWFAHDLERDETRNLTENVATQFVNLDVTPTREQMPSFGVAGWLEEDAAILLNDRWDVWEVALDGSGGRTLTEGAGDEIRYRMVDLEPDADAIDPDAPIY